MYRVEEMVQLVERPWVGGVCVMWYGVPVDGVVYVWVMWCGFRCFGVGSDGMMWWVKV